MISLFSIGAAIASWWWLIVPIAGAALIAGKFFLGWQVARIIHALLDFAKTPGGQVTVGVVAAFLIASSLVQWGRNIEKKNCDNDAKNARIAELEQQVELLTQRAEYAAAVQSYLNELRNQDAAEIERLQREVAETALQSTKPGAKNVKNALMDDRCRYTAYGARRVQGHN
jgi:uncharacterized protein YeaO (DUF488 family)